MAMKKVLIRIDWAKGNYGAAPDNDNVACVATGKTLEEVETNIVEALRFHLEGMRDNGETIPAEFEGESGIPTDNKGATEVFR